MARAYSVNPIHKILCCLRHVTKLNKISIYQHIATKIIFVTRFVTATNQCGIDFDTKRDKITKVFTPPPKKYRFFFWQGI
jgi:hypothetical protein